nr:MAG TPA: hypothetical protein [Caudoviricetes sp.]
MGLRHSAHLLRHQHRDATRPRQDWRNLQRIPPHCRLYCTGESRSEIASEVIEQVQQLRIQGRQERGIGDIGKREATLIDRIILRRHALRSLLRKLGKLGGRGRHIRGEVLHSVDEAAPETRLLSRRCRHHAALAYRRNDRLGRARGGRAHAGVCQVRDRYRTGQRGHIPGKPRQHNGCGLRSGSHSGCRTAPRCRGVRRGRPYLRGLLHLRLLTCRCRGIVRLLGRRWFGGGRGRRGGPTRHRSRPLRCRPPPSYSRIQQFPRPLRVTGRSRGIAHSRATRSEHGYEIGRPSTDHMGICGRIPRQRRRTVGRNLIGQRRVGRPLHEDGCRSGKNLCRVLGARHNHMGCSHHRHIRYLPKMLGWLMAAPVYGLKMVPPIVACCHSGLLYIFCNAANCAICMAACCAASGPADSLFTSATSISPGYLA